MSKHIDVIQKQLENVRVALNVLDARHLTVTALRIEGPSPCIDIIEGPACSEFRKVMSTIQTHNGRRVVRQVAFVSDCQVRWMER